jgi:hypothetical protein
MINGVNYAWENAFVTMPTGLQIGIKEVNYKESQEVEEVYGFGSEPLDYGCGNRKYEGKITLHYFQFQQLQKEANNFGGSILDIPVKTNVINVSYLNETGFINDTLSSVKFTDFEKKAAQGDKSLTVDISFKAGKIFHK